MYKGSQYLIRTRSIGFFSTQIKTLNPVKYFMGWYEHFHLLLAESKDFYGASGPRFPWMPAEALPGWVAWQRCADTCRCEGRQERCFLGQQKAVVSKLYRWLLASCQIYGELLGLLKWEKMSGGAFCAYWSSSTSFSFSILLSCWSRVFIVGPGLQDQANWGGL